MNETIASVEQILADAVEIASIADRQAFLEQACAGNADLRAKVERLLANHDRAGSFLERPAAVLDTIALPPSTEAPGTRIGPYKLLEVIGEGGMGVVYLAEQQQPVRRQVALKVIKPGMDSKQVVARFEAERQALALMDHPNIAKVLDAGATDAGRPYFVMELVRGILITDYCDQARLTVRQRLEVFTQVCRAVQHAHTKGVIHRDLKPSNVLVTSNDGVPFPKVIDFGVAKALERPLTDRTPHTGFAQMIGTPLYMSPEQAEFNLLGVDTRSDIYSLGVLLYELLTGATPFDQDRLRTVDFDELRRILREEEPPRPSVRLSTLGAALTTASEQRGMDPRKLRESLHGELDWIVLKALEKDRTRRYETASAFAADVQCYLNDEQVEACPPSAAYRVRKFARRNKAAFFTTGLIAAALFAGTALSVWQAVEATAAYKLADKRWEDKKRARDEAEKLRKQAEADRTQAENDRKQAEASERKAATEVAIATAINEFLQNDLLRLLGPQVQIDEGFNVDRNLTIRQALDRAAAKIGERFRDQPEVEAAIRMAIGNAYCKVGEFGPAVIHLERAVGLRKAQLGLNHPNTLHSVYSLASAYTDGGRLDEALPLHAQTLELFKTAFGSESATTVIFLNNYSKANHKAGKLDEAERLRRTALEIQRKIDGPTPRLGTASALGWLCRNLLDQKRYKEAEVAARESLAILEREGPDRWHRFGAMSLLGGALLGQEKYSEAEPLLLQGYEGLKKSEAIFGTPFSNWRLTEAVHRIVDYCEATKQPEKARAWREKLAASKTQ